MTIFEERDHRAIGDAYEAAFRYMENDSNFIIHSAMLYEAYDMLDSDMVLRISFTDGPNLYTFSGHIIEKLRGVGLLMIEQLTQIDTYSRRRYDRDELRLDVSIYGLAEAMLAMPAYAVPASRPNLSDKIFDISAGGMCVITNTNLNSEHDPFYLMEFNLNESDNFLLPAKLVRRSNSPRTKIGRYDYGFQFLFDARLDEKDRLTNAILLRKLSMLGKISGGSE
jgi:c-di-GMP-binding flagellar brake protein YcgR